MPLTLRPITLKAANAFVAAHHRHNKPVVGHRYSLAAWLDGEIVGVAIVGRPVARGLDDGLTAEVTRLCVLDGAPKGTCSFLYQAAKRSWQVMGGVRMVTYTLESESGASLRGAGWVAAARLIPKPKPWHGPDRARAHQAVFAEPKIRWEAPA